MKQLIIAAMLVCWGAVAQAHNEGYTTKTVLARVTYYDGKDDVFGKKTATGVRAQEGETVAVDFRVIPAGTVIRIPDLEGVIGDGVYTAQDTGTDVKSRKAAKTTAKRMLRSGRITREEYPLYERAIVIDVHVNRHVRKHARRQSEFMMVEIFI